MKRLLTGKGFAYEICCQGTDARQEKVYFDYTAADSFDVYGSVFVGTCHRLGQSGYRQMNRPQALTPSAADKLWN